MTLDEAEKLAKIFLTVDGGCSSCIAGVCEEATTAGLGFTWNHHEVIVSDDAGTRYESRVDVVPDR